MAQVLALTGAITVQSVQRLERELVEQLAQPDVLLDLSAVTDVDSTAVSLLLHWRRDARAHARQIAMCHPPASLLSLATLYGVHALLPAVAEVPVS